MDSSTLVLLIVIGLALVAPGAIVVQYTKDRPYTKWLREQFSLDNEDTPLEIHPLSQAECLRFSEAWRSTRAQFVDAPVEAVKAANRLVGEVMRARDYPLINFDQRMAEISDYYPNVVAHYQAAGVIAQKNDRGEASGEELRQAMVHYRSLFKELLETYEVEMEVVV